MEPKPTHSHAAAEELLADALPLAGDDAIPLLPMDLPLHVPAVVVFAEVASLPEDVVRDAPPDLVSPPVATLPKDVLAEAPPHFVSGEAIPLLDDLAEAPHHVIPIADKPLLDAPPLDVPVADQPPPDAPPLVVPVADITLPEDPIPDGPPPEEHIPEDPLDPITKDLLAENTIPDNEHEDHFESPPKHDDSLGITSKGKPYRRACKNKNMMRGGIRGGSDGSVVPTHY